MKINLSNVEAIQNELDIIQKRCTARTLTAIEIKELLDDIEKGLLKPLFDRYVHMPRKSINGTVVNYDGAEHFARKYTYIPEGTQFTAVYKNGTWYITSLRRDKTPNRTSGAYSISLTQEYKDKLIELLENKH